MATTAAVVALLGAPLADLAGDPLSAGEPGSRPNIVVLMLDDTPEGPFPRILARMPVMSRFFGSKGVRFANFYGNDPMCCPGRANFLSGLYTHHHGVTTNNSGAAFDPTETIATALDGAGYYTFLAGKYMNGASTFRDLTPPGWDRLAIRDGLYYHYDYVLDGVVRHYGAKPQHYSTDRLASDAAAFLGDAPPDRPIFALLSPAATHGLGQMPVPAPRHIDDPRCQRIGKWRPPNYNEPDMSDKPAFTRGLDLIRYETGWPLKKACEAMLSVDELFATVMQGLKQQGRLDDTIFVLTADNGISWGQHRWDLKGVPWTTAMPLYIRWPVVTGGLGRTHRDYISMVDLAPTLLGAAGADPLGPFPSGQQQADGTSFLRLLRGGALGSGRDALLEEHRADHRRFPPWWAIRTTNESALGLWHYIEWDTGDRELYDLAADPFELENLAGDPAFADTQEALMRRLERLRTST
jgi:arylsulfatase A-like enzyme